MKERKIIEFNPAELLNIVANNLDASQFESLDESQFRKAPNILDFTIDPEFLNATILPKQIQMGLRLFAEYCPICSDMEFFESLFDQDIGTIKEKVVLLEHGKCPVCSATRWELIQRGLLNDYNEFAGCLGQRCVPHDTMINTNRGIIPISEVEVGDIVPNGYIIKKIDSGNLKLRTIHTELGMSIRGSLDSHIVPVLIDNKLVNKSIRDIKVDDLVILVSPNLWSSINYRNFNKHTKWPSTFDMRLCSFLGLLCRKFDLSEDSKRIVFTNNNVDVLKDMFSDILDIAPKVVGNTFILEDQDFIEWFKIMTGFKQIPDGVLYSTEESASTFLNTFLSDDWHDDILRIPVSEIQDIKTLRLFLLNLNMMTMIIGENLCNVYLETDNEYHNKLMNMGYYPVKVTGFFDSEEVKMFDIVVPNSNMYVGDGFLQHNSGKSKFIGIIANYVLHRFLCMPNPIRMFNQSAGDILNISFAGLNEDKVEKNLWGPFIGFMDASPWFQKYHSFLEEKGRELKKPLMAKRTTFVEYFHKKILIDFYGSHGDTMRGDTRIFASADEIAFMGSGSESKGSTVMNADSIYTSLNNSLATMRMKRKQIFNEKNYDVPPILIANISSPSSTKDKIMKQVKASNTNPSIYGVHAATWHCLTKNAIIRSDEGVFLASDNIPKLNGNLTKQIKFANSNVCDVVTNSGSLITSTRDHRFQVFDVNLGVIERKVEVGDQVIRDFSVKDFSYNLDNIVIDEPINNSGFMSRKLDKFELSGNFFKLLGLFHAEGSLFNSNDKYKTQKRVVWYNTDIEIVDFCRLAIYSVWGLNSSISSAKPKGIRKKECYRVQVDNTQLIYELNKIGVDDSRLKNKKMPDIVFKCGKENMLEYLSGFLEGDGCIHNGSNGEISFWNTSENLIRSISKILLILGIPNKIYIKEKPNKNAIYSCRVLGKEAIYRFSNMLMDKLITTKNKEKLKELLNRNYFRNYFYNNFSGNFLQYFKNTINISQVHYKLRCKLRQKTLPRKTLISMYESQEIKCKHIEYILYNEIYLDTIDQINNFRVEDVYDLSIEKNHLYWSDGFISHNCNPDYTEDALLQEYASEDPAEFYRNFGAQPPIESNPFLSEMSSSDRIAVGQTNNFYGFSIEKSKDALGDNFVFGKLVINNKDQSPRLLAFDLGSTKNAFGLCIFKLDQDARIVLEDGLIIKPSKEYKINLPWIYNNITVPLIENYNVKHVLFDKWQSLDQVTRIRDLGINAQVYSLKYDNMDDVRGMVRNRSIILPRLSKSMSEYRKDWEKDDDIIFSEISAQLGIQLLTVRDLGNRMTKPAHGDDDLFRAFCLGAYSLTNTKIIESMKQTTNSQPVSQGPVGVVKSLSGSSITTSSSGIGVFVSRGRR